MKSTRSVVFKDADAFTLNDEMPEEFREEDSSSSSSEMQRDETQELETSMAISRKSTTFSRVGMEQKFSDFVKVTAVQEAVQSMNLPILADV